MALIAPVKDGHLVENTDTKKEEKTNDLGYDQFLQILCAEMQYQDPLEPTSNTEYISQLATFSQLESTLSMQNTIEGASANNLVGKYVIMKVTSPTTGEVSYPAGIVDYVLHQNGKVMLSIGDQLYDLEDLDTVADMDYMEAIAIAQDFKDAVAALPSKYEITLADRDTIEKMAKLYDSLTAYQKSFIDEDSLLSFAEKLQRLNELIKAEEGSKPDNKPGEDGDGDGDDPGEGGDDGGEGGETTKP